VEATVAVRIRRDQSLKLSYAAIHGAQAPLGALNSRYLFSFPSQNGVATWEGGFHGVVARTRVGALRRYGRSPYGLWDVSAAYTCSRLHPYVRLSNITNTSYQQIQGVVMPGRSFVAGVEVALMR
jgi:iron complex outermembrane receptor protein